MTSEQQPSAAPFPPPLPLPPPVPHNQGDEAATEQTPPSPGRLTPGWGTITWLAWTGVVAGFAAVWYSARITGFSTWWLGPESEPRFIGISLLPFVAPLAMIAGALRGARRLPWAGIAASLWCAAFGIGDLGRVNGYAAVEFLLAGGGLVVSLATFAGLVRPITDERPVPSTP
ncbi:MAG: hypothetical protein RI900_2226 [Actinomycetota bacterium]